MTDEDSPVTLDQRCPVEGTSLARVAARLTWGVERSAILEPEGDTVVRTPDGPRELAGLPAVPHGERGDSDRAHARSNRQPRGVRDRPALRSQLYADLSRLFGDRVSLCPAPQPTTFRTGGVTYQRVTLLQAGFCPSVPNTDTRV
jgi:hypothetical protein